MRASIRLTGLPSVAAVPVLGLVSVLGACGGASFVDGVYDDGTVRYRLGRPEAGWQRVEVDDTDLAFRNARLGTIGVKSTCEDYEDVPHSALMNHLLFGTTARQFRVDETVTLDGRGAKHVVADLELDGVPLTVEIYLLTKDGCVFDLSHVAARDVGPAGAAAFHRFVHGFAVLDIELD